MRRLALLTTILVALSAPGYAQDNATVQKLADQFAEAFNKNAATGIGELYAEDAILIPPQADMRMGRKDIQAFWTQQAKEAEGLTIAVLDVKPLGPDAARAVVRGELTTKGDKPRYLTGRNVVVLQKVGVDWKLATHIWNFGAESRPAAGAGRDSSDRESRREWDRDRLRERGDDDRERGRARERERSGLRRDQDDNDRFSSRERSYGDRDFWSRDRDEYHPRYDDRYDRRRRFDRED
jgi:uncharacterized protein (TIGR02246 family)